MEVFAFWVTFLTWSKSSICYRRFFFCIITHNSHNCEFIFVIIWIRHGVCDAGERRPLLYIHQRAVSAIHHNIRQKYVWVPIPTPNPPACKCMSMCVDVFFDLKTVALQSSACMFKAAISLFLKTSTNQLEALLTEFWTASHISTECCILIIGNFQYNRR